MLHPSTPPSRSRRWLALPTALLLAVAACDDQLTDAATPGTAGPRASLGGEATALQKPVLHSNRERYSYHGQKPATGRSGSASLSMQALLGRDGTTEVQLSTGRLDEPWLAAPGTITRVQTRASSPDGKHRFTHNDNDLVANGTTSLSYGALARGTVLQVQANVTGIDPNRTDVVSVTGTVLRRPNLAVVSVNVPARVRTGAWTHLSATIRETNGDVGNWGVCKLYVDGAQVDWGQWIWVDAGDVVTCLFSHEFRGEGTHRVEVRIEPDWQGLRDDDPSDDVAATTVESYATNEFFYTASASHVIQSDSVLSRERWRSGSYQSEYMGGWGQDSESQVVTLDAWTPRAVSADSLLLLEVTETTGGTIRASSVYSLAPSYVEADGSFCTSGQDGATGGRIHLCTSSMLSGATSVSYIRSAGRVSYYSYQYSRLWNRETGEEWVYSYNDGFSGSHGDLPLRPFGGDFGVRVRLHAGSEVYTADPVFPLHVYENRFDLPLSCTTWEDLASGYFNEWCTASSYYYYSKSGHAVG